MSHENPLNNTLNNQLFKYYNILFCSIPPRYDINSYLNHPNQNNRYNIFSYLKNKKLHENKMLNQGIIEIYKK